MSWKTLAPTPQGEGPIYGRVVFKGIYCEQNKEYKQIHTDMKRFLFITLTLLLVAGTAAFAQDKKQKKNANIQEVTFVTTIDCKNCVKKVEANLPYEKGIKDMKVNLDDRTVWIKYDATKTDKEKLAAAIVKLGYEAEEVIPEEAKK